MSDYLAKPIDPTQLEAILERWLCRAPATECQQSRPVEAAAGQLLPPITGLDQGAALSRLLGNRTLYLSLLRRFVDDYAGVLPTLSESLAEGRFEEAREQLHSFKSLAGTLGAEPLRLLSMELEIGLRDGRAWSELYQRFASEFQRLLQALREVLEKHSPA